MSLAGQLDKAMRDAGLNIVGVRLNDENDQTTWTAIFSHKPSAAEDATVLSVLASFDVAAAKAADAVPPVTLDALVALLIQKGVINQAELLAALTSSAKGL